MTQFIMATHGKFADGIKHSINLILGDIKNLESLSCYTDDSFNLKKEIEVLLKKYSNKKIIVITDIFGGSVNNEFLSYISTYNNLHVISGLNLSLMINLIENQSDYTDTEKMIELSIKESNTSVKYCNAELESKIDIPDQEF